MIEKTQRDDTGRSDRASSAATETAQWAVSQSEDCLSESECRIAASGGTEHPEAVSGQAEREPHIREKGLS